MAARKIKQPEKIGDINIKDVVTFPQLATHLGRSMKTLERMRQRGLWSFKLGGVRVTTWKKFNEFLQTEAARSE